MLKKDLLKSAALTAAAICMLLFASCGSNPAKVSTEPTPAQTGTVAENTPPTPASSSTDPEPADPSPAPSTEEPEPTDTSPASSADEPEPTPVPSEAPSSEIAKINGGADEVGIYSIVLRLTDQAADKGVVEMVYYGAKGSPQEDSIVNTFRIEYYKESAGTFEIQTFFDGEVYQNQHHKDEVKVVNTFDATLRAGSVIISYTPDGGDTQEIFSADAEYFYVSTD